MNESQADLTPDLLRYLQDARTTLVAKLSDLSEFDLRRPLTATGTNLLGLVKHLVGIEFGYLGECVGRQSDVTLPWYADGSVWEGQDMWATADESSAEIVALYRRSWEHSDRSVRELGLDAPAEVSWWPEARRRTTLGSLLVRMVAETAQHAGHADIVRELIDGQGGKDHDDIGDAEVWATYVARIQAAADHFRKS